MPVIMKNAVYARKTLAKKARSQLLEQSRQENAKTLGKTRTNIDYYISHIFFLGCCLLHGVVDSVNGMKTIVLGISLDGIPTTDTPLKRSLSIMITKKSLNPHLNRTRSTRSSNGKCAHFMIIRP